MTLKLLVVNANTSLDYPIRSATGARIGIVTTACPEPDGMKKFTKY